MDIQTENYQLKWHSFGSYLHGCVAAALNGDCFTDVSLITMDGRQINAHRFILSACSQYLHQVLKLQARNTQPLSIILPPEINYKTLKVLIQYMYKGETTVSQDILESVLRGGDLLKVKGLWRPKEDEAPPAQAAQEQRRGAKVHNARHTADTPPTHPNLTSDPTDARSNASTPTPHANSNAANANSHGTHSVIRESRSLLVGKRQKNEESVIKTTQQTPPPLTPIQLRNKSGREKKNEQMHREKEKTQEEDLGTAKDLMQILVIKEEPIEWAEVNQEDIELVEREEMFDTEMMIKPEVQMEDEERPEDLYTPLTCELCSETFTLPADWVKHVQTHTDMMPAKRQKRGQPSNDEDNVNFQPLQCDMCQKYFPTPAIWVQHIEKAHTELELHKHNTIVTKSSKTNSSAIRQSRSSSSSSAAAPPMLKITSQHKVCAVCNKKFPSHASMIIHRRTHTGERPYMCDYCCKGFNVKSNLLRHLRTLHDKYVNPYEVESKESDTDA